MRSPPFPRKNETGTRGRRSPWWTLLTVIMATGMPFADSTITNVGRYYIVSGLGITPYETGWLTAGYSLALAVGIPLSHRLRGFLEERDLYSLSVLVFMMGSALVSLSTTFSQAMIGRGLEGLAGGILIPLAPILLQESFPKEMVPAAISLFTLSSSIWVTLGPTIGGLIIDDIGWQWAFGINIPIGCIAMLMAQVFLSNHPRQDPRRFDLVGFLLLASCLGTFFTGYMSAEWYGWHSDRIILMWIISATLFFLFVGWSGFFRNPILPTEVLRKPVFSLILLIVFLQATATFGRLYLLAPFFERNYHFQAHHAGAVIALGAITELLVSLAVFLGPLQERHWIAILFSGCVLVSISNLNYLFLPNNAFDFSLTVISQLIFGAGLSFSQIAFPNLIGHIHPPRLVRAATTYLLVFQFLGGAWGTMISRHLVRHLPPDFLLALSQTSAPLPPQSSILLIHQLASVYTSNLIFFDLGLTGMLGAFLCLFLVPFFRQKTLPEKCRLT
ncbi:MAG: MFS transporter [Leptospirales bacterium]